MEIASCYATAYEESGLNVLLWRKELDLKYAELHGIRKWHNFVVVSWNSAGTVVTETRERCSSGDYKDAHPKMRRGSKWDTTCFLILLLTTEVQGTRFQQRRHMTCIPCILILLLKAGGWITYQHLHSKYLNGDVQPTLLLTMDSKSEPTCLHHKCCYFLGHCELNVL